jgi:hypothetical protein
VLRISTIEPSSVEAVDVEIVDDIVALDDGHIVWIDPVIISAET